MNRIEKIQEISGFLPSEITDEIRHIPPAYQAYLTEIHIRIGQPISCTFGQPTVSICAFTSSFKRIDSILMHNTFISICRYSVHHFRRQIADGYIVLPGGHRVGLVGRAVYDKDGCYTNLNEISSICIRIANEEIGCGQSLFQSLSPLEGGVLLVGLPGRGKTTVSRDLIRLISCERKVTVIDEKGEIAAVYDGFSPFDLGPNTDVLTGVEKVRGINMAVKNMSPEILVCDELGADTDISMLKQVASSGVVLLGTVHGTKNSVKENRLITTLIKSKVVETLVFLSSKGPPGQIESIIKGADIYD